MGPTSHAPKRAGVVVLQLLLFMGCNDSAPIKLSPEQKDRQAAEERDKRFPLIDESLEPRLKTFALADDGVAFARLPNRDAATYKKAAENESFIIDGLLFHEKSRRPLTDADQSKLAKLLSTKCAFRMWTGTKLCGGFNPNVAVRWTFENRDYYLLTCFECREVRVIGPEGTVTYDMETPDALRELLKPYE